MTPFDTSRFSYPEKCAYSKSTLEAIEKCRICSKLTETPERRH